MFNLVDYPHTFPGHTLLGSTRGPVVATGIDINGYVFLDRVEVAECARLFGFVDPAKFGEIEAELSESRSRVQELETELAEAEPILRSLAKASSRYGKGR